MKSVIKNCKVFGSDKTELYIDEGKFTSKFDEKDAEKVFDLDGKTVFPGLVDMHCHLREPGYEYRETIYTGTRSAAKGGYTSVCPMPNTNPVCDNVDTIKYILIEFYNGTVENDAMKFLRICIFVLEIQS